MMTDCRRDQVLGRELGFRGQELGVFPGGGGFDLAEMVSHRQDPPSARRVLAVKGYQNDTYGGCALVAMQAVHRCADALKGYLVAVYGASPSVRDVARHISTVAGLRIEVHEKIPRDILIRLMGRSRVHIAVGTTDGTPNAMLEAMIMGAFPIQSDTVSTGEWIRNGENGILVPVEDLPAIETAIRKAVSDDDLVDKAAHSNQVLMREKAERVLVRTQVVRAYENVKRSAAGGYVCCAET
jgi:glycosyltransferase involved in cell wall biosynthesis